MGPEHPPDCRSAADLEPSIGTVCRVVGRFDVERLYTKKGTLLADWPVVRLSERCAVLIGSVWDPDARLPEAELERLAGRTVAVTGQLHAEPPGGMQNFAMPCVSPVERLAHDDG